MKPCTASEMVGGRERLWPTTPSGSRLPDRKCCLELDVFDCGCTLPCYLQPGGAAPGATKGLLVLAAKASNGAEAGAGADIIPDWQSAKPLLLIH